MADRHLVVVAYDISDDRRRTRLHDRLESWGTPVQYSVFECLLTRMEIERMKRIVERTIKRRIDKVNYYHLCRSCAGKVESTTGRPMLGEEDAYIV